jgi:uncharacterized membrane protein
MTHALTRDLVKTLSFACVHFSVAFAIGYLLTGSFAVATGMALIEPMANTVAFFFHEQAWKRFGRSQNAERLCTGAFRPAPSLAVS